jgi:O-antigen/teichoic acid export membrane protein
LFSSWNGLKIIRETASLGNLELAFSLQVNSPKYILMFLFGEIIVGIFSALLYLYRPSVLFVSSMIQAVSSRLSVLHAGGEDKAVKGLVLKLLTVSFLITAIMAVSYYFFGEWLIVLVFGENFSSYGGILNLVSINYLIAVPVATLSYYGIVRRKYQSQYKIVLFGILSNVVLSLLLGWQFGIKGVLFGWILSSIIILTLYFLSAFGAPQKIGQWTVFKGR